jgi:acetyl-CoA carboxylase biotin carboxyl carrier protein
MKHEKIEELEISDAESHIHLKRKGHNVPQAVAVQSPSFVPVLPVEETASKQEYTGATVQSPIMGMLYRAPSPSSPPFVKEGDVVDIGKTLCIVEAMKVMNEIKADGRMKIIKILVENGKAITANQDLFQIERV